MKRERAYCPTREQMGQETAPGRALLTAHHPRGHPANWATGTSPTNFQGKLTWNWVSQVRSRHSEGKNSNRVPSCRCLCDRLTLCPLMLSMSWFWPPGVFLFCLLIPVHPRPLNLLSLSGTCAAGCPLVLWPDPLQSLPGYQFCTVVASQGRGAKGEGH